MKLFHTTIFKDTGNVLGLLPAEITQHGLDVTDFETNYKADATRIIETDRETVTTIRQDWVPFKAVVNTGKLFFIELENRYEVFFYDEELHDDYVSIDVAVNNVEQEIDLGGIFDSFAISVGTGTDVNIKLNDTLNDAIVIGSKGSMNSDRFEVSKILLSTDSGVNSVTIFATRKV